MAARQRTRTLPTRGFSPKMRTRRAAPPRLPRPRLRQRRRVSGPRVHRQLSPGLRALTIANHGIHAHRHSDGRRAALCNGSSGSRRVHRQPCERTVPWQRQDAMRQLTVYWALTDRNRPVTTGAARSLIALWHNHYCPPLDTSVRDRLLIHWSRFRAPPAPPGQRLCSPARRVVPAGYRPLMVRSRRSATSVWTQPSPCSGPASC